MLGWANSPNRGFLPQHLAGTDSKQGQVMTVITVCNVLEKTGCCLASFWKPCVKQGLFGFNKEKEECACDIIWGSGLAGNPPNAQRSTGL